MPDSQHRHMIVPVSARHGEDAYVHEFRPSNADAYLILTLTPDNTCWMHDLMARARQVAEDFDGTHGEAGLTPKAPLVRWGALPEDYCPASHRPDGSIPEDAAPLARARARAAYEARAVFVDDDLVQDLDDRDLLDAASSIHLRAHGRPDRPLAYYLGSGRDFNIAPFSHDQILRAEIGWLAGSPLRDRWIWLRDLEPISALREILEGPTDRLAEVITARDFLPLLRHGASNVRQQAITAAAKLGFDAERLDPSRVR